VALVHCEVAVPEDLRAAALRALAVQLYDRNRHTAVILALSTGGQAGMLAMLLHRAVASITGGQQGQEGQEGQEGQQEQQGQEAQAGQEARGEEPGAEEAGPAASAAASAEQPRYSLAYVDALMQLVAALSTSNTGAQALSDAGLISVTLPLLRHTAPEHVPLLSSVVKLLETYMDVAPQGSTMFRDLGGLSEMIDRWGCQGVGEEEWWWCLCVTPRASGCAGM
jgi:hypothetical protein